MFSNFLGIFKKKNLPRNEFRYFREKYGINFTFISDIELIVSDDFSRVINTIIDDYSKNLCGDTLAKHVYELLLPSNEQISTVCIRKVNKKDVWLVEISSS